MELDVRKMADHLKHENETAESLLEGVRSSLNESAQAAANALKLYIAAKLMLSDDEISDNIVEMVRFNVARASHISVERLKEMDRPGRCGSAPAVLTKRVMLYLDIQKKLDIQLPTMKLPEVRTVQELADMLIALEAE